MIPYLLKRTLRKLLIPVLFIFLFGLITGAIIYLSLQNPTGSTITDTTNKKNIIPSLSSLEGYTAVDVAVVEEGILLTANCNMLFLRTTFENAYSVSRGLLHEIEARPNPHDMASDIIEHFSLTIDHVIISSLKDNLYTAYLVVTDEKEHKTLRLDSKPSDAIAVATRLQSPVYVHETILEQYGQNVC